MRLTRQQRCNARRLWQSVCENGVPDQGRITKAVREVRAHEGRDAEAVLKCFSERLNVYIRANRIGVISADRLSTRQQEQLTNLFNGTGATQAGLYFSTDPSVIGGLRVEVGHQITDVTITRQLERLGETLSK